jgi:hypothetical protein
MGHNENLDPSMTSCCGKGGAYTKRFLETGQRNPIGPDDEDGLHTTLLSITIAMIRLRLGHGDGHR